MYYSIKTAPQKFTLFFTFLPFLLGNTSSIIGSARGIQKKNDENNNNSTAFSFEQFPSGQSKNNSVPSLDPSMTDKENSNTQEVVVSPQFRSNNSMKKRLSSYPDQPTPSLIPSVTDDEKNNTQEVVVTPQFRSNNSMKKRLSSYPNQPTPSLIPSVTDEEKSNTRGTVWPSNTSMPKPLTPFPSSNQNRNNNTSPLLSFAAPKGPAKKIAFIRNEKKSNDEEIDFSLSEHADNNLTSKSIPKPKLFTSSLLKKNKNNSYESTKSDSDCSELSKTQSLFSLQNVRSDGSNYSYESASWMSGGLNDDDALKNALNTLSIKISDSPMPCEISIIKEDTPTTPNVCIPIQKVHVLNEQKQRLAKYVVLQNRTIQEKDKALNQQNKKIEQKDKMIEKLLKEIDILKNNKNTSSK